MKSGKVDVRSNDRIRAIVLEDSAKKRSGKESGVPLSHYPKSDSSSFPIPEDSSSVSDEFSPELVGRQKVVSGAVKVGERTVRGVGCTGKNILSPNTTNAVRRWRGYLNSNNLRRLRNSIQRYLRGKLSHSTVVQEDLIREKFRSAVLVIDELTAMPPLIKAKLAAIVAEETDDFARKNQLVYHYEDQGNSIRKYVELLIEASDSGDQYRFDKEETGLLRTMVVTNEGIFGLLNRYSNEEARSYGLSPSLGASEEEESTQRVLGAGGFGKVRVARNVDSGEILAVKKQYNPQKSSDREISLHRKIGQHASLQLLGLKGDVRAINKKGTLTRYTFLPILTGTESVSAFHRLRSLVELSDDPTESRFAELMQKKICKSMIQAVHELHQLNAAHLDIKPQNMQVAKDGTIVLFDYGSAQRRQDVLNAFIGTPAYSAPESFRAARITPTKFPDKFVDLKELIGQRKESWSASRAQEQILAALRDNIDIIRLDSKMPEDEKIWILDTMSAAVAPVVKDFRESPEFAKMVLMRRGYGRPYSPAKADSWSLGMVIYEMLFGEKIQQEIINRLAKTVKIEHSKVELHRIEAAKPQITSERYQGFINRAIERQTLSSAGWDSTLGSTLLKGIGESDNEDEDRPHLCEFLKGLLTTDPAGRWSIERALESPYFEESASDQPEIARAQAWFEEKFSSQ